MKKLALVLAVMMMALTLFVSCGEQEPELTTADLVKATWNLTTAKAFTFYRKNDIIVTWK